MKWVLAAPYGFLGGAYPGTGGDCGATLAAGGGTCTIVIEFNPTSLGVHNDTIDISYNDGAVAQNATRDVQGTAGAAATLDYSGVSPFDYGTRATGSTTEQTFTITNNGAVTATAIADAGGLASPYAWKGGTYPGVGGTCGGSLVSLASCTVIVEFSPGINGLQSDQIDLNFNNGAILTNSTHDIQGTGADPANLTISEADPYDFGGYAVGSGTNHVFTVSNGGGVQATAMAEVGIGAPFTFTGGTYPGTGGNCGTTLSAAGNCTIDITFTAAATGLVTDTISMSYNNGVSVQNSNRDIQGTGLSVATLTITESDPYDYGNVTVGVTGTTHSFTVTNTGGSPASAMSGAGLASPFAFLGGTYPGTGGDCSTGLAAAATCTIVVEFAPTGSGLASDTIDINYNDGVAAQTSSRDIQGTGLTPATLTLSESDPYDFGSITVGNIGEHTFNVTYGGQSVATGVGGSGLVAPYAFKGGTYPGTGGTCGATISSNCTIVVTYTPVAPSATDNDTISIDFNNGAGATSSTRDVTAQAVSTATLTLSETDTFDMGSIVVGATNNHIFVLNNTGGTQATSIAEIGLAAPFRFTGGTFPGTGGNCGVTLAPATPCNLDIEFAPTATGNPTDTIDIQYNDGVTTQNVQRIIDGTGVSPAQLTITDGPTYDYGVHLNGSNVDYTFTINNAGGSTATSVTGTGLAAPYTFAGGGGYPGTGGTCTATINASTSCTIVVRFSPTSAGVHNDTIDITYNDGATGQTSSRDITGTGSDVPDAPTSITLNNPASSPGNVNMPTLSLNGGDVASGVILRVYTDAACTEPANKVAELTATGAPQLVTLTTALTNGTHTLYATLENTFGFVSTCSTASVTYEYDGLPPAQPTGVTVGAWHNNLTTTDTISWTNSASGDVATHEVAIADNAPGTNIIVAYQDAGMGGSYSFTGLGLSECTQYWPVVRAVDNAGNNSSIAPAPTPFQIDVNDPGQPGGGTIALSDFATGTQGQTATWTASIEACGVDYYEMAIGSTAGGTEISGYVNIGNVLTYQPVDGVGGFTFSGPLASATNYYISVRAVDLSGRTGASSTSPAFQTTAPNAITDLSYADRSSTSMTLFWSDPGSLGAAITDYNVYYRTTAGPGPWTQFVDGVSTDTIVEVTGLSASTSYDFRVNATNGSEAPDSNIVTESTGPNSPLFDDTQYAAINIGGANGTNRCRVIAFENTTAWSLNSVPQGTLTTAGDTANFTCAAYDLVEADKPIYVMGRNGNHHIGWQTAKFSGTEFLTSLTRGSPHNIRVYAFEATTVTVNRNGAFYANQVMAADTGFTFTTGAGEHGHYEIVSSGGLIAVFTDSGGTNDPKILPPKSQKLIGFPSTRGYATSEGTDTLTVNSTGLDNYTVAVDNTAEYSVATGASLYSGDAFVVTSTGSNQIAINSNADANGNCSAPFMPPSMMSNRFIVAGGTDYVAMASTLPISIEEVNAATGAVVTTHTMTGTSAFGGIYRLNLSGNYSGRIFRATTTSGRFPYVVPA